jgi:hypothetical protein
LIDRRVPKGPDPIQSPPTPDKPPTQRFGFHYEVDRRVPDGPDPIESPPTPNKPPTQYYGFNY